MCRAPHRVAHWVGRAPRIQAGFCLTPMALPLLSWPVSGGPPDNSGVWLKVYVQR